MIHRLSAGAADAICRAITGKPLPLEKLPEVDAMLKREAAKVQKQMDEDAARKTEEQTLRPEG